MFEISDPYTPELNKSLKSQGVEAIFISKVEEVNWLLNLRALGIHFNDPMFNGFALAVNNQGYYEIHLFVENEDTLKSVRGQIVDSNIHVKTLSKFKESIADISLKLKS